MNTDTIIVLCYFIIPFIIAPFASLIKFYIDEDSYKKERKLYKECSICEDWYCKKCTKRKREEMSK